MCLHLADSLCFPSMKTSSSELQESTWISAAAELFGTFTYLVLTSIYPWREELALDPASRFSSQEGSHRHGHQGCVAAPVIALHSVWCCFSSSVLGCSFLCSALIFNSAASQYNRKKKVVEKCLLICLLWKLFISTNICDEEGALNASADNYY